MGKLKCNNNERVLLNAAFDERWFVELCLSLSKRGAVAKSVSVLVFLLGFE